MPIKNMIVHQIDKKPDGSPAALHLSAELLPVNDAIENLLFDLNDAYNAKQGKVWGFFHGESGAYPLSGWLKSHLAGSTTFVEFTREAATHLCKLMEESNLSTGGHVVFAHYQQGMTDYLSIAMLQHADSVLVTPELQVTRSRHLDLSKIHLAARINLSEWKNNTQSKQYISFLKGKNGRKISDYFQDFVGCQQGVDGAGETRTLLKAFTDFVESEDLPEDAAREKTATLVDYATAQVKVGEPVTLQELSELLDEDRPQNFAQFISKGDYELSAEIPADKRVINSFRRFTGRAEGLSISFEQHLLGDRVEFDREANALTIRNLPTALSDQLKRAAEPEAV